MTHRVVKILSIGGSQHAQGIVALVAWRSRSWFGFGDLHAGAALHVVHPNLKRIDAEPGFGHKNVIPIRRPVRRSEFGVGILGNLLRLAPVGAHYPDVLAPFAVGEKRDPLTVRRKLRLAVKSHPA